MQALLPDGSVIDWPEWTKTPQSSWTEEQSKWMAAHQEKVLEMQRQGIQDERYQVRGDE